MKPVPHAIKQFVADQTTISRKEASSVPPEEETLPYGSRWYRAVACMLLSGRVQAKDNDQPNRTDIERISKEANFNQYLFEQFARFFVTAKVLGRRWGTAVYEPGPHFTAFWKLELEQLQSITRPAVLQFVEEYTGHQVHRPSKVSASHLIEFLIVFFHCFSGLALLENEVGKVMLAFSQLPAEDLSRVAASLKIAAKKALCASWSPWLDDKGQKALLSALYSAEWAYVEEKEKKRWFFPSATGLAMLGLGPARPVEPLPDDLKVTSDLTVFAGAARPLEELVPLFRHCRIKRIDRMLEFKLDRRRLVASSASSPAVEELRPVLQLAGDLPATVADVLETRSSLGGVLKIRGCSALVKPPSEEALAAIRQHPRLKSYLEPKAPPGYLLIKATSDPWNFMQRCKELGFEVQNL